jgi:hypothetical protein
MSAWNNSAPTGRIFMKFNIWVFFENLSRKLKFHWNLTRITDTLVKTNIDFWSYLLSSSYSEKCTEELEHIACSITPFFENGGVYGILWKHIVEPGKTQIIIRRMRIACWIPKAKDTHSVHAMPIALPLQQWLHESALLLCCIHCLSCLKSRKSEIAYLAIASKTGSVDAKK